MDREQGHDEERNPAQQRVWVLDAVRTWGVMLNGAGFWVHVVLIGERLSRGPCDLIEPTTDEWQGRNTRLPELCARIL